MATYVDILKSEFPQIDQEVFNYIKGMSHTDHGSIIYKIPSVNRIVLMTFIPCVSSVEPREVGTGFNVGSG